MKLKNRIAFSFISLFLILSIIIFSLVLTSTRNDLQKHIGLNLQENVTYTAEKIDNFMTSRVKEFTLITHNPYLLNSVTHETSDYLATITNVYPFYDALHIVDDNGYIIASSKISNVNRHLNDTDSGQLGMNLAASKINPDFVIVSNYQKNAALTVQLTSGIGLHEFAHSEGESNDDHHHDHHEAKDAADKSKNTLIGIINTETIKQMVYRIDDKTIGNEYAYLVDDPGNILFTQDPTADLFTPHKDLGIESLQKKLEGDDFGYAVYTDSLGRKVISGYADLKEYGSNQAGDWSLMSTAPYDDIMKPLNDLMYKLFSIFFFSLPILIGVSIMIASRISKPIQELIGASKLIGVGQFLETSPVISNDEIGILSGSLFSMSNELKKKYIELDEAVARAEQNEKAKSRFLATMSHEIRTPMNGVLGMAQVLQKSQLDFEQAKQVKTIMDSGNHMMQLLNDILDFSKIEEGKLDLEQIDFSMDEIVGTLQSTYHTVAAEKGIEFNVVNYISEGSWYLGDKARIRQILFNLINNALKFTKHGSVSVKVVEHKVDEKGHHLSIAVTDTGIGITADRADAIFNPFTQEESSTTRNFGGTGLGLSIVKQLSQLMGGDVTIESQKGQGSTFTATFILDEGQEQEESDISFATLTDFKGMDVLIVEDNKVNQLVLKAFLQNRKITSDIAENGEVAIQMLKDKSYDLVLMDNHMPVMDGISAIKFIRKMDNKMSNVTIFACTADAFEDTRIAMLTAGANDVLTKPLKEDALLKALSKIEYKKES